MIKIRTNKSKIIWIFFGILFLVIINSNIFRFGLLTNDNNYDNNEINLKNAGSWELSPFIIDDGGGGDYTWAEAVLEDWCSGNGTWSNPYTIENITIEAGGSGNGITIRDSAVFFIIYNLTVHNSLSILDGGIYLHNVNNSWLSKNTVYDNYHGIELENSNNNTLSNNTVYNNYRGIELENSNNNTLSGNTANSNEDIGIHLKNSNNNILSNNTANFISGSGLEFGIQLEYSNNNSVWQNTANNNDVHGISISNSDNNTVWNNTVRYNDQAGISLVVSDYNTIELNYATKNYDLGIFLHDCYYNDFFGNEVNDNYGLGMALSDSKNNTISGNSIKNNNGIGINLYDTRNENNIITDNYISDNSAYGVQLDGRVKNNLIYNNVFDGGGSTYAVDSSYDINYWDNGSIGNYWDDYTGVDADDDYIGDTPYSIGGTAGAVDNYPIWDDGHNGTPILIDGQASGVDAHNWTWAHSRTWCSGNGTWSNPYVIENLTIDAEYSGSCIEIRNSDVYFIVQNCTLYHGGYETNDAGIYMNNVRNGLITLNNCSNNLMEGLYVRGGENNTISMNIAMNNGYCGIRVSISKNNLISKNTASENNNYDINIYQSDNNTISENNMSDHTTNFYMRLMSSYNNTISSNYIDNGQIQLMLSCENIFWNNTLIGDSWIRLEDSCYLNLVYQNYFRDTSRGVDNGNPVLNQWDNGTSGNYWDDYNGKDVDDNGIGDTPYIITGSASNQDNFPIWWDAPIINITIPDEDDTFETPPNFEISIVEGIANTTWYTLDNGLTNITFTGLSGIINQAEWYNKPNGQISIILYANDSRGYVDSSEVTVIKNVDTPQITIIAPITDQLIGNDSPEFELIINDQSSIVSTWYTIDNGLTNYTFIGLTGTINQTAWDNQEDGTITIQFYAQDSIGNIGANQVIVRKDTENPAWIEPPTDQVAEFGDVFSYDLNATDTSGISYWWVNDTVKFSIDNTTGVITNNTMLDISIYWLEVRVYDPLGHNCSAPFKLIVQDTTAPTWVITPEDQIIELGESVYYDLDAYDLSNIGSWEINDTTYFSIDSNGIITNITELEVKFYYLEVRVYDAYGNNISAPLIITVQDSTAPTITINTPNTNELFGIIAPNFNIEIYDANLDTMWYTLDNGLTNTTFTTNGPINQALWDALPEGNIVLRFFAKDSAGNIGFAEVTVRKDVSAPIITINNPQNSDVIGAIAPNFDISIDELNLDKTWYSLNGGNNVTFTGLTGTINQALWDALSEGNIVLRFYANDTSGKIGFREVTVVKKISQSTPPEIPGYNMLLLLGIISTIAVIIVKKRLNHLN